MKKKYCISNILGSQKTNNNEWFTPKEPIYNLINTLKIPKNKIIWCPFDTENSNFVICLKENGYKVINSHKDIGQDFYSYEPETNWDIIISNPPFTKKRLLIERCEKFNKPFCLLYGCSIFSQSMGNTLNRCDFIFVQKNINFINNIEKKEKKSFQCVWVLNKGFKWK